MGHPCYPACWLSEHPHCAAADGSEEQCGGRLAYLAQAPNTWYSSRPRVTVGLGQCGGGQGGLCCLAAACGPVSGCLGSKQEESQFP